MYHKIKRFLVALVLDLLHLKLLDVDLEKKCWLKALSSSDLQLSSILASVKMRVVFFASAF